jgi:hypothetical protein
MISVMSRLPGIARFLIVFILLYPFGVICHELIGHGLPGLLFGGKPTAMHILGLDLHPHVQWRGWQGHYGYVDGTGVQPGWRMHVIGLGGALSTTLVAAVALFLLWRKPRRGYTRLVLISLSLWWLDLFTYTLPSWGIRRSIFWGRVYSEPYEAAVGLGVPGPLFQFFVLALAVCFVTSLWKILRPVASAHSENAA